MVLLELQCYLYFFFFLLVCFLLESLKGGRVSLSLILDVIGKSPNLTTDNQVIAKSCVILVLIAKLAESGNSNAKITSL